MPTLKNETSLKVAHAARITCILYKKVIRISLENQVIKNTIIQAIHSSECMNAWVSCLSVIVPDYQFMIFLFNYLLIPCLNKKNAVITSIHQHSDILTREEGQLS